MEMVELFGVSAVDSPGLTGIEEGGMKYCTVDPQLGGKAYSFLLPDILMESPEGRADFSNLHTYTADVYEDAYTK